MNQNPLTLFSPDSRVTFPEIPWTFRDLGFGIVFTIVGIVALNLGAVALTLFFNVPIMDNGAALAIFVVIQDLIIVLAALSFSAVRYRVGIDRLGLRAFDQAQGCLLSGALLALSLGSRICFSMVMLALGVQLQPQKILKELDVTGATFFLTFFSTAILAPIAEEIFFRGFLYGGLRPKFGALGAMIISSFFFTTLHFSIDAFVPILILGLSLAWLYERTGSLYPGIFLHMTNNALAVLTLLLIQTLKIPM